MWFKEGADVGDEESQLCLAECSRYGQGVEVSLDKAVNWYKVAAAQGNIKAQTELKLLKKR